MSDHDIDYSSRLKDAGIICAQAIDALVGDLERRRRERLEEQPDKEPRVTMAWVLDELVAARNLGVKLDNWLDLSEVAHVGNSHRETARRRWHEAPEEVRRRNGVNGKLELHVEYVAELLDETIEEVKEELDKLEEAA